jgi:uncharacterized membrane protein YedE/YeeE
MVYLWIGKLTANGMWLAEVGAFYVVCSFLVECLLKVLCSKIVLMPQFWQTMVVRRCGFGLLIFKAIKFEFKI